MEINEEAEAFNPLFEIRRRVDWEDWIRLRNLSTLFLRFTTTFNTVHCRYILIFQPSF